MLHALSGRSLYQSKFLLYCTSIPLASFDSFLIRDVNFIQTLILKLLFKMGHLFFIYKQFNSNITNITKQLSHTIINFILKFLSWRALFEGECNERQRHTRMVQKTSVTAGKIYCACEYTERKPTALIRFLNAPIKPPK